MAIQIRGLTSNCKTGASNHLLHRQAHILYEQQKFDQAIALDEQHDALGRGLDDDVGLAHSLHGRGIALLSQGENVGTGIKLLLRAERLAQELHLSELVENIASLRRHPYGPIFAAIEGEGDWE